eukprot:364899-Chlamydomonas_euryale.AAC.18
MSTLTGSWLALPAIAPVPSLLMWFEAIVPLMPSIPSALMAPSEPVFAPRLRAKLFSSAFDAHEHASPMEVCRSATPGPP